MDDDLAAGIEQQLIGGSCDGGEYLGTYSVGGEPAGRLACYSDILGSWVVWTINDLRVSGTISGESEQISEDAYSGDTALLYDWFVALHPLGPLEGSISHE